MTDLKIGLGRFEDSTDMGKNEARLIFADPPYGITNLSYDKEAFDYVAFWEFCQKWLRKDGVVVLTGVMQSAMDAILTAPKKWFRYDLVWEKPQPTGFLNAKKRPLRCHEYMLVFSPSGSHIYNPQMTHGHERKVSSAKSKEKCSKSKVYGDYKEYKDYDSTDRYPRSVMKFATDKQKGAVHPNQKPVELLRWIIRTFTNEGDLVVDPVAGSGTTGIAAVEEKRNCIMIEKEKNYYEQIKDRFCKSFKEKAKANVSN